MVFVRANSIKLNFNRILLPTAGIQMDMEEAPVANQNSNGGLLDALYFGDPCIRLRHILFSTRNGEALSIAADKLQQQSLQAQALFQIVRWLC